MLLRRIDILGWTAIFLFSVDGLDRDDVLRQLINCDPPASIVRKVSANLDARRDNEGFTYSNSRLRRSVVYIGPTSSGAEFLSSFCHELAHLVCDLCIADDISLEGEKIAYIQGEIAMRLSGVVCELSCDHCRGDQ